MASQILGLELSANALRLALVREGRVEACAEAPLPPGSSTDSDALAAQIRQLCRSQGFSARRCALLLPRELVTDRRLTVSKEEIGRIPAHFPDHDPQTYEFSHHLIQMRDGQAELYAAAVRRSDLDALRAVLRKAGLSMTFAIPQEAAWESLLSRRGITDPVCILHPEDDK